MLETTLEVKPVAHPPERPPIREPEHVSHPELPEVTKNAHDDEHDKTVLRQELGKADLPKENVQKKESPFNRSFFQFRRKVLRIFGGEFDVYGADKKMILHSEQKRFRLKEDFVVYPNKESKEELLRIKGRNRINEWGTFDVYDPQTGEHVGSLKRHWLKSTLRDTWTYHAPTEEEIGKMEESSWRRAIFARLLPGIVTQTYQVKDKDEGVSARIRQHFNPFVLKYSMDVAEKPKIDRRLLVATGFLLSAIERRETSKQNMSFNQVSH